MMHLNPILRTAAVVVLLGGLAACKKEKPVPPVGGGNPPPPNEQELITTVILHFESLDGTDHKHFVWRDLDGDGGNAPEVTTEPLLAGVVYRMHIELLDETQDPPEDITHEVEDEADEHQFFYIVSGADATFVYDDADADGNPVGIETLWTMGAASVGTLRVILLHEPDKDAAGVSEGDPTNAGGDTDVDITFPMIIE